MSDPEDLPSGSDKVSDSSDDVSDSSDDEFAQIRAYATSDVDLDAILKLLHPINGDDDFSVVALRGYAAQQVCQRHRDDADSTDDMHSKLFLIFDRDNPQQQGVLLVNLKPYHKYPDAVRQLPEHATNCIASLNIVNTEWHEVRGSSDDTKTEFWPANWFALYNLLSKGHEEDFSTVVKSMNDGVQYIGSDAEGEEPKGGARKFHRAIGQSKQDLAQTIAQHSTYARDHGVDAERFAVVDKEEGILFIQIQTQYDSFRCKLPVAGELLNWIYIGFMTWEDAKAFASLERPAAT
ncbi:hypothetical protein P153DRAFT_369316 [Dothidotthia symphoricarpi CBS 119687]|uniref:Uncharacterized protein n=1 Tax=Dothidotthia symphoricarpi CBS 119687 TaxID=1392245 RepID=A0A6A6A639_9PLEO|nr:uncharacterized protein P153DRAFT_369316 [Dothidotthia symphoricarpi CBS 119687]KAF2126645.1 hypothetical protein P153DRAFT_369316 [Dothidotthia symphoricarpi CBS 119687]